MKPEALRFPSLSVRAKLLLLVLLAVVPALGALFHATGEQRRQAIADALRQADELAYLAALDFDRVIVHGEMYLGLLARLPEVQEGGTKRCPAFLARELAKQPHYLNLGVADPGGDIACSALPSKGEIVNIGDRKYFRRALETGRFAVGDFQVGRITGAAGINFGQPVMDRYGKTRAVVFAAVSIARLNELAAAARLPQGSSLTVMDHQGTVLAQFPDPGKWVGTTVRDRPLARHLFAAEQAGGAELPGLDGVARFYCFRTLGGRLAGNHVHVAVGLPREATLAGPNRQLARSLAVFAAAALLMLAVTWYGSDAFILRRMRNLLAATRRLAAGDFSVRSGLRAGRDELAELGGAFDNLAAALAHQSSRVAALNRLYSMLSRINGAILRLRDRDALLAEACHIAVEAGGFRLAWIGLLDPPTRAARIVAWAGEGAECMKGLRFPPGMRDPVHGALEYAEANDSAVRVCNDLDGAPRFAPWRAKAREFGLRSMVSLPLRMNGAVVGGFNLYSAQLGFFDTEEVHVLEELAADITLGIERIGQAQQLSRLANYDSLTGLPNRALCEDRLHQALAQARHGHHHVAVLSLRLENMRQVSGVLGRHLGDSLLKEVAARLAAAVREGDTVARMGGASFGVVLGNLAQPENAALVVARVLERVPNVIEIEGQKIVLTLRAGVAVYPADGEEGEDLMRNAELAVHEDHAERVAFYSAGLGAQARERHRIQQELHGALERGEFSLVYQPVIEIGSRRIQGVEALLRWENPKLGKVSPDRFIPVAEQSGLIIPLGEWVLASVCREAVAWAVRGFPDLRVAVNVSARQLHEASFAERVCALLRESGCEAHGARLAIEITESELMRDVERVAAVLARFKKLGLLVYVDDFGTGYSSLSYLNRLPVDVLKIDKSFVRDLATSPEALSVVKTVLALAASLGLEAVAEGVETERQVEILHDLRCRFAQGYFFSRPMPSSEITTLLENSRAG